MHLSFHMIDFLEQYCVSLSSRGGFILNVCLCGFFSQLCFPHGLFYFYYLCLQIQQFLDRNNQRLSDRAEFKQAFRVHHSEKVR